MKKWNRMLAAVLSASMIFSMAPAGVWAAETAAVQESQEESGEFDAAMAAAQNSEEALAGGSDAASAEVTEEAESGAAVAADEATDDADAADQADAVDEAAGADADTADAEGADATDEAGADADMADANADEDADAKDAVIAEEADAASETDTAIADESGTDTANEAGMENTETNGSGEPDTAYESEITEQQSEEESSAKEAKKGAVVYFETELEEVSVDLGDKDEIFEEYANHMFYGAKPSSGAKLKSARGGVGYSLDGTNLIAYQKLREMSGQIADGNLNKSDLEISAQDLGNLVDSDGYTAEELGVTKLFENDSLTQAASNALYRKLNFDSNKVLNCLSVDCAYELYWSTGQFSYGLAYGKSPVDDTVVFISRLVLYLTVDPDFRSDQGDKYSVDTDKTGAVKTASNRAKQIVKEAENMGDYNKLNYYREQICDLVEYNYEAAANSDNYPNHGPWNLIFVFDDDPTTNVVCEGYAEAFQYLSELTTFISEKVQVYSVTGTMSGGTGAGKHKWNIVRMENGNNYLTDITNSDAGSIGSDGSLFLAGMEGSVESDYHKACSGKTITYTYKNEMRTIYSEEELTLSLTDYNNTATPTSADDKAILKGLSLFLTDKIGMRVYVKTFVDHLSNEDYMEFSYADKTVEVPVSDAKDVVILDSDGKSIHVLAFEIELWTKQMTEEVSFRLHIGNSYGMQKTYSVRSYADQILAGNYSEKQKDMVRAMLNYGGYAQTYFKYNTDKLANDSVFSDEDDPVQKDAPELDAYGYSFKQAADTKGIYLKQAALNLGTDVSIVYYYELDEGKTTSNFVFNLVDSNKNLEYGYDDQKGMDYVVIRDILPTELGKSFTLTVTPVDDTTPVTEISYSPFSYCKSKIENPNSSTAIKDLCKSLYYYWYAATKMESFDNMVNVTVQGQEYTLILQDNAEARAFADRLPLTLTMDFDNATGFASLGTGIPNSGPVTTDYRPNMGDLVLAGERGLSLVLVDNISFPTSQSYVTIGTIQNSTNLNELVDLGNDIEVSFTAQ